MELVKFRRESDCIKATRIAYGGNKEFRRVVTLDGALFEGSGTMSGGGSKPRGGRMGTAIRAASVSREAVISAENELANMVDSLNTIRQRIFDAAKRNQASEKVVAELEMEIAKSQKEDGATATTDLLDKLVKECEAMLEHVLPKFEKPASTDANNVESLYMKSTISTLRVLKEIRSRSSTVSVFSLPPLQVSGLD